MIDPFYKWLHKLKDNKLKSIILGRFRRIKTGNFGDYKSVKGMSGLYELRIHYQNGCRIYFTWDGTDIVIVICGGSKSNQKLDIEKAKNILVKGVGIYELKEI